MQASYSRRLYMYRSTGTLSMNRNPNTCCLQSLWHNCILHKFIFMHFLICSLVIGTACALSCTIISIIVTVTAVTKAVGSRTFMDMICRLPRHERALLRERAGDVDSNHIRGALLVRMEIFAHIPWSRPLLPCVANGGRRPVWVTSRNPQSVYK